MTNATFRPIDEWPDPEGLIPAHERVRSPFKASYDSTLILLDHELRQLGAEAVVIKLALPERDIRLDGQLRADARDPDHPGVVVEFDSHEGWLRYYDDQYPAWEDNLRAVALSLEALRALNRWGALRGEQYVGSRPELEAGPRAVPANGRASSARPAPAKAPMSREEAARYLGEHSEIPLDPDAATSRAVDVAYRYAARKLHPDHEGGSERALALLQEARETLDPDRAGRT